MKLDRLLKLARVFNKLDHLFFSLVLSDHLCYVFIEATDASFSEKSPQILNQGITEENKSLATTILKEDLEVIVSDVRAVDAQSFLDWLHYSAIPGDLRRFYQHVQGQLNALRFKDFLWYL